MNNIYLGGVEPVSLIDWPGKTSTVLFFMGCPMRCKYCHNSKFFELSSDYLLDMSKAESYIIHNEKYIDAVVFSGGEPYFQYDALKHLSKFAHANKLLVGVETSGIFPDLVKASVDEGYVDHVFLDIKCLPEYYNTWAGNKNGKNAFEVLTYGLPNLDVRTTVFKENVGHVFYIYRALIGTDYPYTLQQGITKDKDLMVDEVELNRIAHKIPYQNMYINTKKGIFKV